MKAIIWSPLAIQRVLEEADFIALDKPEAATRWAELTFAAVKRLELHPMSGRVVSELGRAEIREVIHGAYRIIYRVEENMVNVLTVRRSSRLLDPSELA